MLSTDDGGSHATGACESIALSDDNIPEWAQLLEPVRKLPTNSNYLSLTIPLECPLLTNFLRPPNSPVALDLRLRVVPDGKLRHSQIYYRGAPKSATPMVKFLRNIWRKLDAGLGKSSSMPSIATRKSVAVIPTAKGTAFDVSLTDDSWTKDTFEIVSGNTSMSWERLDAGALVSHAFELDSKVRTLFYRAPAVITFCVPTKAALQVGHWSDGASILLRGVRAEVCWITNQKPSEKDEWYTAWNIRCWAEEYRSYTLLLASLTAYNLRFWCLHRHSLTMNVLEGSLLGIIIVLCFYAKILSTNISLRTSIVIRC
ncbi:hypothetical protein RHMOL_Rhmol09G0208500 [Rhododendron molle]|uniref:Uncharacterized protein n=1 Tax=Rhododendron molle TaxID=49168 RepID=A0ACC0MFL1_RHOML|nr:hypothetical protein RHMOL_Rhmol09G0208500 [Rhododendron molle]